MNRRKLLKLGLGVALAGKSIASFAGCAPPRPGAGEMPSRPLGKTGVSVSIFGLGGQATLERENQRDAALQIIEEAVQAGVTYFDTAKVYGPSEDYLGEGLQGHRDGIFLATKTHARGRDESLRLLDDSLRRLRTDRIDLWQLHDLKTPADLEAIFAPGGALEALERARAQRLVRFIGVTGHYDPAILEEALRRHPFDAVLIALNAADRLRRPFQSSLIPLASQQQVGMIAMKVVARGGLVRGTLTMAEAVGHVWTLPTTTAIIGCDDVAQVRANARLAGAFRPLSSGQMAAIEARALAIGDQGSYFKRRGV